MTRILLISLSILILLPFGVLTMLSFGQQWAFPNLFPAIFTVENWVSIWSTQSDLSNSLWLSLGISLSVATNVTVLSLVVSKYIAYHPARDRWLLIAYFPYMVAPIILATCIQFYFIRMDLSGKLFGVLLAQLFVAFPFGVIFFVGFWNRRMLAMEQLVATLGGNAWQTWTKVLLPVAKGAILVCFFQTFLISWFEYGLTTLIGVGKVQTLTLKVFQFVNEANIFYAALASISLIIPPTLLLYFNKRYVFNQFA